jgi:hypothetical protein
MYYGVAPVNQSTLQGEFLFHWVELGSTQACSRVSLVSRPLIHITIEMTTQKVEPADGCQEACKSA